METVVIFIFLTTVLLAYANGANDNCKGVATLYGSKTLDYKKALAWTTFTTAFGCGLAMFLAGELVIVFKGKGLVPDDVILMPNFPLAVGAGAAITDDRPRHCHRLFCLREGSVRISESGQ